MDCLSIDIFDDMDKSGLRVTKHSSMGSAIVFDGSTIHDGSAYEKRNVRLFGYGSTDRFLRNSSEVVMNSNCSVG